MRFLGLSGSLRSRSTNSAVLRAAGRLARSDESFAVFEDLGSLPHFNPDLDSDVAPEPVRRLRRAIGHCEALVICSPEYARGVPGALKNALDWLVASAEFPGKPVAVINASQRATHADASLRLILDTMSGHLVGTACITLPLLGRDLDADGIVADPHLSRALRGALDAMARVAGLASARSPGQS